jgi:hypothetical protein
MRRRWFWPFWILVSFLATAAIVGLHALLRG